MGLSLPSCGQGNVFQMWVNSRPLKLSYTFVYIIIKKHKTFGIISMLDSLQCSWNI